MHVSRTNLRVPPIPHSEPIDHRAAEEANDRRYDNDEAKKAQLLGRFFRFEKVAQYLGDGLAGERALADNSRRDRFVSHGQPGGIENGRGFAADFTSIQEDPDIFAKLSYGLGNSCRRRFPVLVGARYGEWASRLQKFER